MTKTEKTSGMDQCWKRVDERKRLTEKINAVRSERIKERLGRNLDALTYSAGREEGIRR